MRMSPPNISTILLRLIDIVDLPAPVLPTIPTFMPGSTLKLKSFSTVSVLGLYFKDTFLNSISPLYGQFKLTPYLVFDLFSYIMSVILNALVAATISFSVEKKI